MPSPGAKKGEYLTDRLTEEGVKFIGAHRDRPFFLYQSYHSVHTPIQAKKAYVAKYKAKRARTGGRHNPTYAGMVRSLDDGVGRICRALVEAGVADRTAVFFMSDNGGLSRVTDNGPLRAGKGHIYEGGIREPMIVRAPGLVRPGSLCRQPVTSVDFYPTILALAGADTPAGQTLDGASLLPLLTGRGGLDREAIYWHYPHYSPQGGRPAGAVRRGRYKLIERFDTGSLELYDLAGDIAEKHDLAARLPDRTAELHRMLVAWRMRVGAKLPRPRT